MKDQLKDIITSVVDENLQELIQIKQYLYDNPEIGHGCGQKCSVIPDWAAVKYLVRAETVKDIEKIRDLFIRCAEAACKAVGTTYEIWNNEPGNMNVVTNEALSDVFN